MFSSSRSSSSLFFFFSYYYSYICRKCEKNFLAGFPIPNKFYCIFFFQIQQESEINTHHQVSWMIRAKKKKLFSHSKMSFHFYCKIEKISWNQSQFSHLIFGVTKSYSANFRKSFVTFNDTLQAIGCVIKDTIFPSTYFQNSFFFQITGNYNTYQTNGDQNRNSQQHKRYREREQEDYRYESDDTKGLDNGTPKKSSFGSSYFSNSSNSSKQQQQITLNFLFVLTLLLLPLIQSSFYWL